MEPAVNFSRRHLLVSLGLALPAVTIAATEASAATSAHKKHKPTHHSSVSHVSHKRHKPTTHKTTQS